MNKIRVLLSMGCVRLAQRFYPKNPDVQAFYMQILRDMAIYGAAFLQVNPEEIYKEPPLKTDSLRQRDNTVGKGS